jgi:hypothetical protein
MCILINTNTSWDDPPRARKQVALALSKKKKVIYISGNQIGKPKLRIRQITENIIVIDPCFPIDPRIRYRIPIINELYQGWLFRNIKKKVNIKSVINFDQSASKLFKYFKNVIFYCNDDFYGIAYKHNPYILAKYLVFCYNNVIRKSKFCIGISELLVDYLRRYNPKSFEIRLGGPDPNEIGIKPAINLSKNRVNVKIGLIGFITTKNTSSNIINELLSNQNYSLTIIGPVKNDFKEELIYHERIIYKGILTGKELFNEINSVDVCIAPYNVKKLNRGGTPNKLWQYLSMGKPVVVTEIIAIKKWKFPKDYLYISKSDTEFIDFVKLAYERNNEKLMAGRINLAKKNTWDNRIEEFLEIYNSILNG